MKKTTGRPDISKRIFWDINFETLDFTKDRLYIIEKVMNYGLWSNFLAMMRFYGKETVRKEVVKSSFLKKDVLNFLCFYLELTPTAFECYTKRQLLEQHGDY